MLELDWRVQADGEAALVAAVVDSEAPTPRRVQLEATAPRVCPPRERGVPERGWDGETFEAVVPAEGRLAVGFATDSDPPEPPVRLVDHERADPPAVSTERTTPRGLPTGARATTDGGDPEPILPTGNGESAESAPPLDEPTADGVLRSLGSPSPPRDAVPEDVTPAAVEETGSEASHAGTDDGRAASPGAGDPIDADNPIDADAAADAEQPVDANDAVDIEQPVDADEPVDPRADPAREGDYGEADPGEADPGEANPGETPAEVATSEGGEAAGDADPAAGRVAADGVDAAAPPGDVADWLDAVEARVERAEELAAARELTAAAAAVERTGGLAGVEALLADLADDEAALRAVAERAAALAERTAASEEVPVEAYRRLA